MPVKIEFETRNDAFAEGGRKEVALILLAILDKYELQAVDGGLVRDGNGNTIGSWQATVDAEQKGGS